MRKILLFILFVLCHCIGVFAQKKKFVTVKAGEKIMDALLPAEVFYYPFFTNGKVFLKDGSKGEAKMNYNHLVDEIQFINANGDTLALNDEENIKYVAIEKDTFGFDKGFLKLLLIGKKGKLAAKQIWIVSNTRQLGAYNSTNSSVSISSFTSYNEGGRLYDLIVNADIVLTKTEQFYLSNNDEHFVVASKKNLMALFPKEQKAIGAYVNEKKVDYSNHDDLMKLILFLEQL